MKKKLKQGAEILGLSGTSDELIDRLMLFAEELLRWNKRINLTSITEMNEVVEKHLLDSLMLLKLIGHSSRILDVGSGAGIPVIPLALALPHLNFYSLDSIGKKINFQKHIKRQLGVQNLDIQCARIEEIKKTNPAWQAFDVVVARAVAHCNDLLKMTLPLIKPGGLLIAMKGPEGEEELSTFENSPLNVYAVSGKIIKYKLPFSGAERCLIPIVKKVLEPSGMTEMKQQCTESRPQGSKKTNL